MGWTVLLLVLLLAMFATVPVWPYSRAWSRNLSMAAAAIIVVLVTLALLGIIAFWHPWPAAE